jgi:hypothetical protein
VQTGDEGEDPGTDIMEISRPDGLGDIANLGLTLSEAKQQFCQHSRQAQFLRNLVTYCSVRRVGNC